MVIDVSKFWYVWFFGKIVEWIIKQMVCKYLESEVVIIKRKFKYFSSEFVMVNLRFFLIVLLDLFNQSDGICGKERKLIFIKFFFSIVLVFYMFYIIEFLLIFYKRYIIIFNLLMKQLRFNEFE